MRVATLLFVAMVLIGAVTVAADPTQCASGCTRDACVVNSPWGRTYPCTCPADSYASGSSSGCSSGGGVVTTTTCDDKHFGPNGKAGVALLCRRCRATDSGVHCGLCGCGVCSLCACVEPVLVVPHHHPALNISTQYCDQTRPIPTQPQPVIEPN